jgi:hypothetical protein
MHLGVLIETNLAKEFSLTEFVFADFVKFLVLMPFLVTELLVVGLVHPDLDLI